MSLSKKSKTVMIILILMLVSFLFVNLGYGDIYVDTDKNREDTNDVPAAASQDIDAVLQKFGYDYKINAQIPNTITLDGKQYAVKEVVDYLMNDFGIIDNIALKVTTDDDSEEVITINSNDFETHGIEASATVDLSNLKTKINFFAETFDTLNFVFDQIGSIFPDLKGNLDDWFNKISSLILPLDFVGNPPKGICEMIFSGNLQADETGTKAVSVGGSPALFLDAKKQLVKTGTDNENDLYYYRFSFGVDPSVIFKQSIFGGAVNSEANISIYAKTNAGDIVYIVDLDENGQPDKEFTVSEKIFYSNAIYSRKELKELCMVYQGSLIDLNDFARPFLSSPFCVPFYDIGSEDASSNINTENDETV